MGERCFMTVDPQTIDDVTLRYAMLPRRQPAEGYNFEYFQMEHLLYDLMGMLTNRGIRPGQLAPDFSMPKVGGGLLRLSELRYKPVLLHFTSLTSPLGISAVEPFKKLYSKWSNHIHF